MSNVNMGSTGAASVASATTFTAQGMSPDELLEYCQMQLSGLNGEISTQMNQQNLALQEREAVENAQDVIEGFGSAGPQNITDFQTCENAISKAAASLPPGDPVAAQLTQFGQQIAQKYGYTAPQTLTPEQQQTVSAAHVIVATNGSTAVGFTAPEGTIELAMAQHGALTSPPANNDWQGTTDTLSNMADGIKSGSEIQMLSLQDLVSQEQQAVQLASGMMSTEDQTLESEAKNIGG